MTCLLRLVVKSITSCQQFAVMDTTSIAKPIQMEISANIGIGSISATCNLQLQQVAGLG